MKGHAEQEPASGLIEERISYDEKGDKIKNGELAPYTPESAAQEVEDIRKLYEQLTGRSQSRKRDIIMYWIEQSFKSGKLRRRRLIEQATNEGNSERKGLYGGQRL